MTDSIEFSTVEQYEEARDRLESLLLENHKTLQKIKYLSEEMKSQKVGLNDWQDSLDREQDLFSAQKEKFETDQHNVIALQARIGIAIEQVNLANRDPIETINEILLLLELDHSPEEIAKHLRSKRDELDVKW